MPMLEAARGLSFFSVRQLCGDAHHGPELARAQAVHDTEARVLPGSEKLATVGARFIESAEAAGATLLLMGAYTHSRVRQSLLGGVTRHVLSHATVPSR